MPCSKCKGIGHNKRTCNRITHDLISPCELKYGYKYKGDIKYGMPNGYGTAEYINSNKLKKYIGNWLNGLANGYGELTFISGDIYKGNFINDKFNGQGKYIMNNGCIYTGGFVDNRRHGYGKYKKPNGYKFKGNWFNDKRHGMGKFIDQLGIKYAGEWLNNKKIGTFKIMHTDGTWETKQYDIMHNVSDNNKDTNQLNCSICHTLLNDKICTTECNHVYHTKCLTKWSKNHNSCPLCRNNLY